MRARLLPRSPPQKPNVVFILADNVGYGDLNPYGGGELRGFPTPRSDQLAREGVGLTQFLVEPSLHAVTLRADDGQYSIRNGLSLATVPGTPNTLSRGSEHRRNNLWPMEPVAKVVGVPGVAQEVPEPACGQLHNFSEHSAPVDRMKLAAAAPRPGDVRSLQSRTGQEASMIKKLLMIAVALGVIGAATGGALYYFYPVQVSIFAGLTRNYIVSSTPPGTTTTELNAAYKAAEAVAASPAADAPSASATAGDWPSYNRTVTSDRYSQLSEINTKNVGQLKVLCTYDVGEYSAFESGLIMVENALIGTTVFDIFSLNPATCALNWRTHEDYPLNIMPANRGAAYLDGMLFRGTQDGRVLAYDFKTGKRIWETTIADTKLNEIVSAAPIAWDGLVFVGNAGGDFKGAKGRMYALDAKTGKIVWEFFLVPKTEGDIVRGPQGKSPLDTATWKNATGIPISGGGPGPHTRSTQKPGCSTSPAAIRLPISQSACARARISIPTRSSCSTQRPGTTRTISSWCRKIGTTGTSPTRRS